jgi:hypothetical protein
MMRRLSYLWPGAGSCNSVCLGGFFNSRLAGFPSAANNGSRGEFHKPESVAGMNSEQGQLGLQGGGLIKKHMSWPVSAMAQSPGMWHSADHTLAVSRKSKDIRVACCV